MKTTWDGNVIKMDFSDEGHNEVVELDLDGLLEAIQQAGMRFGFQTKLRNFRAQVATDTHEGAEACKRVKAGIALLESGTWAAERQGADKVSLTEAEQKEVIEDTIYSYYKGLAPTKEKVLQKFYDADESTRGQIMVALRPHIDKRIKDILKQRKLATKIAMPKLQ